LKTIVSLGAGKHGLRGIEAGEQFLDGLVVSCMREMAEPDGQCAGGQVGREIGVALKDLPQEKVESDMNGDNNRDSGSEKTPK
jgi:hypothetical protein